jgi:hypothetical protein
MLSLLTLAVALDPSGTVPPDIARAVLTRLVSQSAADVVLCLKVNEADPPKSLVRDLQRRDRTIVAGSECHYWSDMKHPDYQISTGRPAHFLSVSKAVWSSDTALSVQASDHYNGKWAIYWTARVVRRPNGWKVLELHVDSEA